MARSWRLFLNGVPAGRLLELAGALRIEEWVSGYMGFARRDILACEVDDRLGWVFVTLALHPEPPRPQVPCKGNNADYLRALQVQGAKAQSHINLSKADGNPGT